MNNYLDILYVIFFFACLVFSFIVLLASNFEKNFKQGKIVEIRIAYAFASVIISYLFTKAFIELLERIFNIFS
ncbi:MAG: DUF1146 family protein [Bacilli bacterium]